MTVLASHVVAAAHSVGDLISGIKSADETVRSKTWPAAGPCGAPAIGPLVDTMSDASSEIARAAKRALWVVVRHAGRPGAAKDAQAVEQELIARLRTSPPPILRELLWMLSEIGSRTAVPALARLLANPDLREDARCALLRIPSRQSRAALKTAMRTAPDDFRFALADALRQLGEKVDGYPSRKLIPTKQTEVKAAKPA
jgi:HEAT repeat protein